MDRRIDLTLVVALLVATAAGCNSASTPGQATASTGSGAAEVAPTDPAAKATYEFLEAVVKADDQRVSQLLTPLAMAKIQASGKSIHLPGLDNYKFHVEQVRYLSETDALVQCKGADRSGGKDIQEEHEWMLRRIDNQWRIAAIAFQPDPKSEDMIYSFEHPEWGAIPAQQFRARMMAASQSPPMADAGGAAAPNAGAAVGGVDGQTPRTAQEGQPASYR